MSETEYEIFDTFASEDDRGAYHAGVLGQAIRQAAPGLLSEPSEVQPRRILARSTEVWASVTSSTARASPRSPGS